METGRKWAVDLFCIVVVFILALAGLSRDANAQIFSEDLTMHISTTRSEMLGRGGGTTTSTEYYSRNAMKMNSTNGDETIIIQFDAKRLISIDNKNKTYTETTFEQMQNMLNVKDSEWNKQPAQMQATKESMGMTDAPDSVTRKGPGGTIAGYSTEKYLIKEGPAEVEIFAAPSLKIPAAYYDALKMHLRPNPVLDGRKLYDEMKKTEGIPLKTVTKIKIMDRETIITRVVTSIEKGSLPASVFEIPQGYARVETK